MRVNFLPVCRHLSARRPRRGFTVIEVLVAAAITAVLAGFIVAIASNVSGFWTRTSGKLTTDAQARVVLDQLTLDLSSAVFRDDGNTWMAVSVLNGATGGATGLWQAAGANGKPSGTGVNSSLDLNASRTTLDVSLRGAFLETRHGTAGEWLRFFTTKRGSNTANNTATFSAPVAVGYQIIRRLSGASTTSTGTAYMLHRSEVRPVATAAGRPGVIESGYDLNPASTPITNYNRSNFNGVRNDGTVTGDPRSIQIPGARTNFDSVIADNVIDFGVRCYVRDATKSDGLRLVFPANDLNGTVSNAATATLLGKLPGSAPVDSANFNQFFPDVVDVMVRILTDEGARVMAKYEVANSALVVPVGSTPQQYWWQLATANSQVFTRRIVLNTRPL